MAFTPGVKTNIGNVYVDNVTTTPLASDTATFSLVSENSLSMSKKANKGTYFPDDPITFTITISNSDNIAYSGIVFKDAIDSVIVPASGTEFTVTTTSGTISSRTSNIEITDITVPAEGNVIVEITGKIDSAI